MEKFCEVCGKPYQATRDWQKYCSHECSLEVSRRCYTRVQHNLPTGTIGAMSELRVATDLLSKGYEVFRALSQSCSCDLAILQNDKLLRVEVKTGNVRKGKLYCPNMDNGKHDILAIVDPINGQITYKGNSIQS